MSPASRSLVPVNALVLGALIVGLLNNVVVAATFGLTRNVDAFYAAATLPSLFMFLCVDYLGKNFLPVLALARKEGDRSASQMVSTIVTIMALVGALTALVLAATSNVLFTVMLPGFDDAETALVTKYFLIMAPAVTLMAINTFHEYVCQYDEDFVSVMAIRLALPVMNLAAIVVLGPTLREYCLPVGYLLGHVVMFVLLARKARYRYRPRITIRKHLERRIFTNAAIVMSTGLVARTKSIVVNVLGSMLGDGAIAALAFATKLTEPLERASFSGARMFMFSRAARLYADNRVAELGVLYAVAMRVSFLVLVPFLWWVTLTSDALVATIFGRGQFTADMTVLVGAALAALAPSVLFTGVGQLLTNAFYAMNRIKVPALILPFGMLVFVAAATVLSRTHGAPGIALATTLAAFSVFVAMLVTLSRTVEQFRWRQVGLQLLGYCALGAAVMGTVVATARELALSPLTTALVSLPVGVVLYFGFLAATGDPALRMVTRYGRQWFATRSVSA